MLAYVASQLVKKRRARNQSPAWRGRRANPSTEQRSTKTVKDIMQDPAEKPPERRLQHEQVALLGRVVSHQLLGQLHQWGRALGQAPVPIIRQYSQDQNCQGQKCNAVLFPGLYRGANLHAASTYALFA